MFVVTNAAGVHRHLPLPIIYGQIIASSDNNFARTSITSKDTFLECLAQHPTSNDSYGNYNDRTSYLVRNYAKLPSTSGANNMTTEDLWRVDDVNLPYGKQCRGHDVQSSEQPECSNQCEYCVGCHPGSASARFQLTGTLCNVKTAKQ